MKQTDPNISWQRGHGPSRKVPTTTTVSGGRHHLPDRAIFLPVRSKYVVLLIVVITRIFGAGNDSRNGQTGMGEFTFEGKFP